MDRYNKVRGQHPQRFAVQIDHNYEKTERKGVKNQKRDEGNKWFGKMTIRLSKPDHFAFLTVLC